MVEIRDRLVAWKSERFCVESKDHSPMVHFYEDDDPRVVGAVDKWGKRCHIVGYTDFVPFTAPRPNMLGFGDETVVYYGKGNVSILAKESVKPLNFTNYERVTTKNR